MSERTADGTAFDVHGAADAPPVVLIHGLGLTRGTWDGMLPSLAARYRVATYDLAGHGQSAPPADTPTLRLFAAQLARLLDHLGLARAALVGFSLGGMINRRFALDHAPRCAALGVLNSPHERAAEAQRLVEERARATDAGGIEATLEATLARWFTKDFREREPATVARVRAGVLRNDPDVYAACRRTLATGVAELVRPTPPIAVPTLVMTSEHDSGSTPAMSRAIAAGIAGSETVIVPGLQHMGLVESPAAFATPLLDFLERRYATCYAR